MNLRLFIFKCGLISELSAKRLPTIEVLQSKTFSMMANRLLTPAAELAYPKLREHLLFTRALRRLRRKRLGDERSGLILDIGNQPIVPGGEGAVALDAMAFFFVADFFA